MAENFHGHSLCHHDYNILENEKILYSQFHSFKIIFFIASIWPSFNFFMAQELFWLCVENNEQNKSNVLFWLLNFFF